MKRQQLTAILLSAVLSVSICLPPAGITAWAAEGMTEEQTTEQVQENADNVLPGEKDSGEEKDSVEGVTADEEGNGGEEIISEDAAAYDEDKYSSWQSPEPVPYGEQIVGLGETYTLNIETETNDERALYFQWYQGENEDELIEGATSSSLDAVMYVADNWNHFLCRVTDDYNNMIEIRCLVYAYGEGGGGETQLTGTPIGIDNPGTATFSDEARWVAFSFTPETDGHYTLAIMTMEGMAKISSFLIICTQAQSMCWKWRK